MLLLAAYFFIDYGWREPGAFGLTVFEQLLIGLAYIGLVVGGIVWALRARAWGPLAAQALLALAALFWQLFPGIPLDATDHQDLIGATRAEALEALDGQWLGERSDETGTALTFRGLDVYLTDERRVARIVASENPVPESTLPSLVAEDHQDLVGQPYQEVSRALSNRGGYSYGIETDASGTYAQFNGLRVYIEGEERVSRVVPSSM